LSFVTEKGDATYIRMLHVYPTMGTFQKLFLSATFCHLANFSP